MELVIVIGILVIGAIVLRNAFGRGRSDRGSDVGNAGALGIMGAAYIASNDRDAGGHAGHDGGHGGHHRNTGDDGGGHEGWGGGGFGDGGGGDGGGGGGD